MQLEHEAMVGRYPAVQRLHEFGPVAFRRPDVRSAILLRVGLSRDEGPEHGEPTRASDVADHLAA